MDRASGGDGLAPDLIRERVEEILALGRECARHMPPEWRTMNIDEYLYDELGLPE